jgi:hypothetical protein
MTSVYRLKLLHLSQTDIVLNFVLPQLLITCHEGLYLLHELAKSKHKRGALMSARSTTGAAAQIWSAQLRLKTG